jgi:hypothetical protein
MPYDPMDALYNSTDPSVPAGVPADPKSTASTSLQMGAGSLLPVASKAPPIPTPSGSLVQFQQYRDSQDAQDRETMNNAFIDAMTKAAVARYGGSSGTGGLPGLGSIPGIGGSGEGGGPAGSASSSISFGGEAP